MIFFLANASAVAWWPLADLLCTALPGGGSCVFGARPILIRSTDRRLQRAFEHHRKQTELFLRLILRLRKQTTGNRPLSPEKHRKNR
jgi:hypothetical protein